MTAKPTRALGDHSFKPRRCCRLGLLALIAASLPIASCTTFDPLDQTGETINRNATDYTNNATLLNVVRSSLSEPLTFITITGLDGTDAAGGSLGLPGITFGPHVHASTRDFVFGPNSVSRSNQNTFHISVVDDPGSFTALLAPLNPAMIGFFIRQGYSREILFFLFTDRVREVTLDPASGQVTSVVHEWFNDPTHNTEAGFGGFIGEMATLLANGLTAEIDVTTVPTGRALPLSKLCIDTTAQPPSFVTVPAVAKAIPLDTCETEQWIQTQGGGASTSASSSSGGGTGNTQTAGRDNSLWVALASQNKIVRITHDVNGKLAISQPIELPASPKTPKIGPYVAYPFKYVTVDKSGAKTERDFQLFMRSTYGVYNYVGALLHQKTDVDSLAPDESGYGGMIKILKDAEVGQAAAMGCFADAEYRGSRYCVPNSSNRTKQLFALLHQLQELNTAPSNAPTTLTVVPTPGP